MVDIWEGSEVTEEGEMAPSRTADSGHRAGIYSEGLVLAKWSQIHLNFRLHCNPKATTTQIWAVECKKIINTHPVNKWRQFQFTKWQWSEPHNMLRDFTSVISAVKAVMQFIFLNTKLFCRERQQLLAWIIWMYIDTLSGHRSWSKKRITLFSVGRQKC